MTQSAGGAANPKRMFHSLVVSQVISETHDTKSLVFEIPPHLKEVFQFRAGQFLTFQIEYGGVPLKRSYSLASSPEVDGNHKVTVKRVDDGRISNWLNDNIQPGHTLMVWPPDGRFVLTESQNTLVLFAGGSGITPIISILKTALWTTRRNIVLLYANRDARSVIFQKELEAIHAKANGRLKIVHRLDDTHGYCTPKDVQGVLAEQGAHYYMCGPTPFMDTVENALKAAGVGKEFIHLERFVSPADPKPAGAAPAPAAQAGGGEGIPSVISVELNGEVTEVPYKRGLTVLQAAVEAGLDAPYSCEEGFCACCLAQLKEGKVTHDADDALSDEDRANGCILACQARPTTSTLAIKFEDYLAPLGALFGGRCPPLASAGIGGFLCWARLTVPGTVGDFPTDSGWHRRRFSH